MPFAVANLTSPMLMTGAGIIPPDSVIGLPIPDLNLAALLAAHAVATLDQAIRRSLSSRWRSSVGAWWGASVLGVVA